MILSYCTNETHVLAPGVYTVDTVLDPNNPMHQSMAATYKTVVQADLGSDSSVYCPQFMAIENGVARLRTDSDKLPEVKADALGQIAGLIDVISSLGCVTTVIDGGKAVKMDCDRISISNMEALITIMQVAGLSSNLIRDYDNGFHNLTLAQIQQLHIDLLQHGLGAYQTKWTAEAQVSAATTTQQVADILAGLPKAK